MTRIRQSISLAILGLLCIALGIPAAQAGGCHLVRLISFPVHLGQQRAVTVPLTLNGTKETFMVDTGGFYSMLSARVADTLHLDRTPVPDGAQFYLADGSRADQYVRIDKLGIGPAVLSGYEFLVVPKQSHVMGSRVAGTIAPDFLHYFDLDFDFADHKFSLFSTKHCEGKVVYWSRHYGTVPFRMSNAHIVVDVTLDGKDLKAIIDTGSTNSEIMQSSARSYFGIVPGGPGTVATHDSLVPYAHRFKKLTIADVTVNNPRIGILPDNMAESFRRRNVDPRDFDGPSFQGPPIILGMDILTKMHLYVAYEEHTIYATPAAATVSAPATASAAGTASSKTP